MFSLTLEREIVHNNYFLFIEFVNLISRFPTPICFPYAFSKGVATVSQLLCGDPA